MIQFGYDFGNAAAQTSDGCYLVPVNWVTLIYFALSIYTLTTLLISIVRKEFQSKETLINNPIEFIAEQNNGRKNCTHVEWISFIGAFTPNI